MSRRRRKKGGCPVCRELTVLDEDLIIAEIHGGKSEFFKPNHEMIIKYCPVCGKKLWREEDEIDK